jgi:hypothetical protein
MTLTPEYKTLHARGAGGTSDDPASHATRNVFKSAGQRIA